MKTMAELKALPQWVGYTKDKIPMNPRTGRPASSNDPATWATAAEAWAARNRHGWPGIGYVFTIAAGVVGVDLDDCFDEDGVISDEARQIVYCLNSYTELSPSGKGLHILACGSIPHSVKRAGREMYNELRYFTVTGNRYGTFSGNIEDRQAELMALFVEFGGDVEPAAPPPARDYTPKSVDEAEVKRALNFIPKTGDYNTDWIPVLMAVHDAFPDERGISLIESWSPGYKGEVARKWRSFDRTAKQGVTIASLFHIAKRYGYQPPQKPGRLTHADKMAALARA